MKTSDPILMACLAIAFSPAAGAAIQTYTQYAGFQAATAGLSMQANALDGFSQLTLINSGDTYDGVSYSFDVKDAAHPNAPHGTVGQATPAAAPGNLPYLAQPGLGVGFQPGDTVTLEFSAPITAFGVTLSIAPQSNFQLWNAVDNTLLTSISNFSAYGEQTAFYAGYFLGLTSDTPFSGVTLKGGYKSNGITPWSSWSVGRLTYGPAAVPLPASWTLFLAALPLLRRLGSKA